ncbi:aldo/keto reductase [Chitinophaga ginsengisoli]|uniref:Aryl-alcohol dehydrogenase-like predicted oxidoreductase n=1 Tax=Chitinophaga ginsengisoli TaxID=363837 RepID=A0A2P8G129_9BACT|nr:aldo/keto reductase [Chitinophaga ginsengisoli]PSL27666.1 aryl-alcohol dehydrogenase-like predicted oxidoreductase [Chitinophaga ginsengisoli]
MEKRQLGRSALQIAPLVFGGNVFGWTADEATSFSLLDAFVSAGFNTIDTADSYSHWVPGHSGGESEAIIGKWLKKSGKRDQVIIATKVGGGKVRDLSPAYIEKTVEESLRRLQTDYIDLYQSHYDDPNTPVDDTLATYDKLVKAGKVRVIGASNFSPERLLQSLESSEENGFPRYESLQPLYNLYDRQKFEREYLPITQQYQLGVISYYSLASGFLSGKYRSKEDAAKSARGEKAISYLDERGQSILETLDEVAADFKTTPASVAIAWLVQRPDITAPIVSATNTKQLEDLVKATQLGLDAGAIEKLNIASDYVDD